MRGPRRHRLFPPPGEPTGYEQSFGFNLRHNGLWTHAKSYAYRTRCTHMNALFACGYLRHHGTLNLAGGTVLTEFMTTKFG